MTARGRFISIEGQDGAGKSTNLQVMRSVLQQAGISFVESREPGGTEFGETVRQLLLSSDDQLIGDMAELLMIFAARAQHLEEVIEPALSRGDWVLCDRFTDATYAYQGGGRGLAEADIARLEQTVQGDLRPDLTILLDLPVSVGEDRAGQRSAPDRFEKQRLAFKQKVRDRYLQIARDNSHRVQVIDAGRSLQQVEDAIVAVLQAFIDQQIPDTASNTGNG